MSLTQCEKVKRHLEDFGSIDSRTAISEYGIMRLASRISDLKRNGVPIRAEMHTGMNRYGEKTHYSVYRLIRENQNAE